MRQTDHRERERLAARLEMLRRDLNVRMRGRMVPDSKAVELQRRINETKAAIDRIDRDAAHRLRFEQMPVADALEVIAIPLLADVMNDLVAGVDSNLRRNGVQESVFGDYTAQIRKAALAMVDTLEHSGAAIPRLHDMDDTLVDSIKKKLMSFIRQRLKITK